MRLVREVGIYEEGKFFCRVDKILTKEYQLWYNMLQRNSQSYQKLYPTYKGCSISSNFKNFQFFAEWCQYQAGFGNEGWCLDKDILVKGNKEYSEETCVFIPQHLNKLLTDRGADRGEFPIGVTRRNSESKFQAQISKWGERHHLGYYFNQEDALSAYKSAKECHLKEVGEFYKEVIDTRAYSALMGWKI